MTQFAPESSVIELDELGAAERSVGRPVSPRPGRRRVLIAVVAVCCLLGLAASVRGRPSIGEPLWTGSVSLTGFTLGTRSLYVTRVDGKAVNALDLHTGRLRWSNQITELPDSVTDLGNGVDVVKTRPLANEDPDWPTSTLTLVRDATGEVISHTTGDEYALSRDGRLLLVFSRRFGEPTDCAAPAAGCLDVTAWDASAGTVVWRLSLGLGSTLVPSIVDGRLEALAEFGADDTVRMHDVATGAVTGTVSLPAEAVHAGVQVALVHDLVITAVRGPAGIALTAYRRPSLAPAWSAVVADFSTLNNDRGEGGLGLWACGPDVCLTVTGAGTWILDSSSGSVRPPILLSVIQRLGGGVFLAGPLHEHAATTTGGENGFIVDPDGRTRIGLVVTALVDWPDGGDRVLLTQEGLGRTTFQVAEPAGSLSPIGSVPGTGLTCRARADIVACSDPAGTLRVWRLPL